LSGLYLITLPIGNSEDITVKALRWLKEIDVIYAEDTRVFKDLLRDLSLDYNNKMIDSFHDHSESKIDKIVKKLLNGEKIALVSDAGSPVISDPAYPLIREVMKNNIPLYNASGITSVVCALELSGLPANPFHFWGFIGRSDSDRKQLYHKISSINGTHIFFESPHRIYETIKSFFEVFPNEDLVVARELTKKFQDVKKINIENLNNISDYILDKGEFVLLFHNKNSVEVKLDNKIVEEVTDFLENGGNTKKLAKIFSKILNQESRVIYNKMILSKEKE
jgi:16S rRNA (cytidine1402-2'-O)-methyltransferase